MKTVLFATSNKGKAREVRKILKKFRVKTVGLDLHEDKALSHEKLVVKKAWDAFKKIGKPVVVEDTGLFVDGFKNYPGLNSKGVFEQLGISGFAKKCGGRKAFFRTIAGYCDGKKVFLFKGICRGRIAKEPAKKRISHLPYLSVFIPSGFKTPVAAFSKKELETFLFRKNHRAKAFKKLEVFLQNRG